jgi:hypothetical protein
MSLRIAAAAYVYIHLTLEKKNRRQTRLFTRQSKFGGNSLLNDLRTQEINGQFQSIGFI